MENHLQTPYRLELALECEVGLIPRLTASLQGAGGSLPSNGASVRFLRTLDLLQTTSQPQKEEIPPPIAHLLSQGKPLPRIIMTWSTHPLQGRLLRMISLIIIKPSQFSWLFPKVTVIISTLSS